LQFICQVHALRDDDACKKSACDDDTSSTEPLHDPSASEDSSVVEKITSQKRKAKDAKKKAMKRL
jgi:hypothetical protein